MKYEKGLFIFHRDLRTVDNTSLLAANAQCNELITCFIFTPEQVGKGNEYRSNNAIQFMIESLFDLSKQIRDIGGELVFFYGETHSIVKKLIKDDNIDAVFFNCDYSPYAQMRDDEVERICKKMDVKCLQYHDYYLYEPGAILVGGKNAYKKFTPFYEKVLPIAVDKPDKSRINTIVKYDGPNSNRISLNKAVELFIRGNPNASIHVHGGRVEAIKQLKTTIKEQRNYGNTRDILNIPTSGLSAAIKFGCLSVREVYHTFRSKFGVKSDILRQLIWRDFYAHVLYAYPEVLAHSYQPAFRKIRWRNSESDFEAWKKGETGFPLVDACMRQLNITGYMHNRGRMVVANFLIKTLLLDWHLGERYFAQKLVDYDPASNNGNWQGISGTGVDMKPYYRDMNPWIQSAKFDKDAEYIKRWVPELKDVDARDIHQWAEMCKDPKYKQIKYRKPMVDYNEQKEKMMELYQKYV